MSFSKSFPRSIPGSSPIWEEIKLSEAEEKEVELKSKFDNIRLFSECVDDARKIIQDKQLKESDITPIAISLFEKRASHTVFYKEAKAKEKFDKS